MDGQKYIHFPSKLNLGAQHIRYLATYNSLDSI